jgi:hypothetical protein
MSISKVIKISYRLCWWIFTAFVVVGAFAKTFTHWWIYLPAVLATVLSIAGGRLTARRLRATRREPAELAAPVAGRWVGLNSPTTRVPSHGTHAYGQTYAIDIVADPKPGSRPAFRWVWPVFGRNRSFPAFGEPLLAVADATVVRVADGKRDHLSRNSPLALLYMLTIDGPTRDMGGAGWVLGNHVTLDLGNGTYATYAHLQHGSATIRAGDRVHEGQIIGRCGNSGNSSEPHVHFQLMDHVDPDVATGIPFHWRGVGVPANGEAIEAGGKTVDEPMSNPG